MSYLNPVRLHFFGQFQAAPSTVNNDPLHFDNATFQPSYQERQVGGGPPNGWWNPQGDATWRLIGCKVTGAFLGASDPAASTDPIFSCLIADSDRTVAGKLVDLDPEQQLVSEIWGMQVRICSSDGRNFLRGHYRTAAFADIWDRSEGGGGDIGAGAMYQSVLYDLEWGDVSDSLFLTALRQAASGGKLSIKFNVDSYNMSYGSPDFTRGRIAGTIGPAADSEPEHLVVGRHFMAARSPNSGFFTPAGKISFCVAAIDSQLGKVFVDTGNALPSQPSGEPEDIGTLTLACQTVDSSGNPSTITIDTIPYKTPDWYADTAGVAVLPAGRGLTAAELAAIESNPLALLLTDGSGNTQPGISEPADGLYVRADRYVYRMDPGCQVEARLHASRWGKPYTGARILTAFDPSQLQSQEFSQIGTPPDVAEPEDSVQYPARVVTGAGGVAILPIQVTDPRNPRGYIDGQVYGLRPMLEETLSFGANYPFNPWEFVSLLVWDAFREESPITWYGSMQPIFQQYANLYPVMSRFLNLADYDSVCANLAILRLAFGLPMEDPNSMPVTRDLSDARRRAILHWLTYTGSDGKPLLGEPPAKPEAAVTAAAAPTPSGIDISRGGKAAAAARRLELRRRH